MDGGNVDELLSPIEIARFAHVHVGTVRGWLKSGKLKGRKLGGLWRVSQKALDEFCQIDPDGEGNGN